MSDGFTESPSLADRTLDVKAVIEVAGVDRANVIGFEFGSQVAIGFAAAYPRRVRRLVLVDSRVGRSGKALADELNPAAEDPDSSRSGELNPDTVGVEATVGFILFSPSLAKYPEEVRLLSPLPANGRHA